MSSQPGKQTMAIHILLSDISIIKSNQAMKFGPLIEYNIRNIFHEEPHTNCGGGTFLRPFPNRSKLSLPLDQKPNVVYSLYLLYRKLRAIEISCNLLKL